MCGVIVVDAGKSWSTCLGCDAYIHDHCLGFRHNYLPFYQLLNSNLFTHLMLFVRGKSLVKTMAPGLLLSYIKNNKNTLLQCYFIHFILYFCSIYLSTTIQLNLAINRQGIDNPLFMLGARICCFVCRCC